MQIILLSGGSGKRLWPLSNDIRSKQFLKLLTDENGNKESIVQRTFSQIRITQPDAHITIATNEAQADIIKSQLGQSVDIVIEPERRDTFPAIALACAHLFYEKNISDNEAIFVLPCDPFTEVEFFRTLSKLEKIINANTADIALIGIKPLHPTSKYGYIVPSSEIEPGEYSVSHFVEKPDEEKAAQLIKEGAYWNGGVFAFKLGSILNAAKSNVDFNNFNELYKKYSELQKISFDYKIVENAKRIAVVPYSGKWTDIGTWCTLAEEMPETALGLVTRKKTHNTFIVNELNIPLIALSTKDVVIAASPDGILVSDLSESSQLKQFVDTLENTQPMYEERHWGESTVLGKYAHSQVKHLYFAAGKFISNQPHKYSTKIWVIASGEGNFTLGCDRKKIVTGDILKIEYGQKHKIEAISDLHIIEIQTGNKLDENDIQKFE
ncbi:MAG: sugar phosphate nucleotidyltransferase [Defluviitaleaceae bacterium]|nr:sugar phosphate nucleotidyltransferase [Defluviitaleaceae bacterium]